MRSYAIGLRPGDVLLSGPAVVYASQAVRAFLAEHRRDGLRPPPLWVDLADQLERATAAVLASGTGSPEVPQTAIVPSSAMPLAQPIDCAAAAAHLGCSARYVRILCGRGEIASGRLTGGRWLMERAEVQAMIIERQAG